MSLQPSYGAACSPLSSPLLRVPGSYSSLLFLIAFCQQRKFLAAIAGSSGEPVSSRPAYRGLHIQRDAPCPPSSPAP